jgi:hypothetical protein
MEDNKYSEVRAEAGVVFPMTLKSKMWLTVGTLLVSTLAAPAAYIRRDYIRELEGTASLPETLSLLAGVVILVGNLSTFFDGLYMLKYVRERTEASSPTRAEIKKQVRVEDFIMYWQVWGTLVVVLPLVLLVLAGVFPGVIEPLYDAGIAIYQPFGIFTIDIRLVAGVSGGGLGLLLWAMWWLVR